MSRGSHFGISVGIGLFCVLWCFIGVAWFFGLAVSRDSVSGASIFDSSFIVFYVFWGSVFLGCLWGAFQSFRRAARTPQRNLPMETPTSSTESEQHDLATPDEKLAHLVKKPKDEPTV
jgi:hypothetical protein